MAHDAFLNTVSAPWAVIATLLIVSFLELARAVSGLLTRRVNPSSILAGSFLLIILVGSGLLMLPNCTYRGISYVDSLFTATSAVCVTGLTSVSVADVFTTTGQTVILILIQIGGLGIMTITSFFSLFFMGQTSLKSQLQLGDLFSSDAEFYWNVGVNDWETGRFITMRNADHTKELVVAYNTSTTGTKTFNYTFDNPDGNYYIVAQTHGVSTISFDAKAGTITLPQHCFVVIGNEDAYNGVDDVEIGGDYNNITIFPNPAADYIYVNSNDVESIEVYSLSGQLVATSNGANSMDVSSLAAGNYIVRIFTPQGVQAQKLMKR